MIDLFGAGAPTGRQNFRDCASWRGRNVDFAMNQPAARNSAGIDRLAIAARISPLPMAISTQPET
jgi:hypothetical protein